LQETNARFLSVTGSLAIQTTELANEERQDKLIMTRLLKAERRSNKEYKRKLQVFQSVKEETNFEA
jgi:hypothetical protein